MFVKAKLDGKKGYKLPKFGAFNLKDGTIYRHSSTASTKTVVPCECEHNKVWTKLNLRRIWERDILGVPRITLKMFRYPPTKYGGQFSPNFKDDFFVFLVRPVPRFNRTFNLSP